MLDEKPIDKKRWRSPLLWAIVLSVLFHLIFLASRWLDLSKQSPVAEQAPPIEIAELPKNLLQKKEPEMAETEDAQNRKEDPNAKILSDRNQRVEKDTRSRLTDDFRKKTGSGPKGKLSREAPATGDESKSTAANESDVVESSEAQKAGKSGVKRNWRSLSLKDLTGTGDAGTSAASDDRLSDVEMGDQTLLSTKEFKYFSYYHRIKELLRQYWKPSVEAKIYRLWEKGRSVSSEEEMTTKILVLLNEKGQIENITRVASSGVYELDQAAIEAFERAAPFPNPPKGIIDPDGLVRIRWDFILRTESVPRIQFQTMGTSPRP